jgi:tRNA threonylcarbamoyladenosine biosynthesis protein TsaB
LIDTCGYAGTVALADLHAHPPAILSEKILPDRSASECLLPAIRALVAEQGSTLQSLAALAVVTGPGSFTGIRVGLSAAKGLVEGLAIPILAHSRLAVLAGKAPAGEVIALLDAGRGEFYCGHYGVPKLATEQLATHEEILILAAAHPSATLLSCEPSVAAALKDLPVTLVPELTAADALPLAIDDLARSRFADPVTLDANYVRRTDAQLFVRVGRPAPKPA